MMKVLNSKDSQHHVKIFMKAADAISKIGLSVLETARDFEKANAKLAKLDFSPKRYYIKVFITKNLKFRAEIKTESFPHGTEVTVGGKKWEKSEFDPFRKRVLAKCNEILVKLHNKHQVNLREIVS